ncbi:HEPN domain-containing protein [Dysgonomonas sp. HDW5A]|nr:HEPN domain-containing protein [Dysgonomonas sp. HDW5A]
MLRGHFKPFLKGHFTAFFRGHFIRFFHVPLYAIRLVNTLENPKQHNLTKLLNSVKKYSNEFIKVFPLDTAEEKRLFELIKAAYVNGRYDPDFVVTKEDIDALVPKLSTHNARIRKTA